MPGSWLGRRAAMALRRLGMAILRTPVDDVIYGQRMRLFPFHNVCEKRALYTPQFFDPVERAILGACAREDFVFLDIGANVGLYSLFVAGLAPQGRIFAFEPQPDLYGRLLFNLGLNPPSPVKALPCALADRDGDITLFVDAGNRGESSVKFIASQAAAERETAAIRVPARTLAGVLAEEGIERVDAMKIDVEGAEDLVLGDFLRSAPEALLPNLVIIEDARARWQVDLVALMAERGYHVIAQTRLNLVLERGILHRSGVLEAASQTGARTRRGIAVDERRAP